MDQKIATAFELNQFIRFYGELIGTTGLSPDNNAIANEYLKKLLEAQAEGIERLTATAAGLITG